MATLAGSNVVTFTLTTYNHNLLQFLFSAQKTPQGTSDPCVRNLEGERSRAVYPYLQDTPSSCRMGG
jgi:hypothetical protein